MKLLITLQLEESDTHPATLRIAGSSGIVLNSVSLGHVSVAPELVHVGVSDPDERKSTSHDPDKNAE